LGLYELSNKNPSDWLSEYQYYYDGGRIRGKLGRTPVDREVDLSQDTLFMEGSGK
jgi:hypothetical protein